LDDVEEDDLESPFFADSIADVENAATRAFAIGVRILANENPAPQTGFGVEESELEEAAHAVTPTAPSSGAIARTPMAVEGRLGRDRIARRAFILGGPRALDSLAAEGG